MSLQASNQNHHSSIDYGEIIAQDVPIDVTCEIPMSKELSLDNLTDDGEIEAEDVANADGEHHTTRPYDPRLIRVEPKMFSLRNIMDMIEENEVDLAPDFQRSYP